MPKRRVLSPYNNKSDVIRPAHNTNDNSRSIINVGSSTPNTLILFSPTARARPGWTNPGAPNMAHGRFNEKIYVSGYKERVAIQSTAPFIWRRIVFWTYNQIPAAIGPRKGGSDASTTAYYTRQMTPIVNAPALRNLVFQGTDGIDYTAETLYMAPLNHSRIDVVMDKSYNMNPLDSGVGRMQIRKHYYRGGRIWYMDEESGNRNDGSPWSVPSSKSKGNMYILDVFSDGGFFSSARDAGAIQCEGRLYWSE